MTKFYDSSWAVIISVGKVEDPTPQLDYIPNTKNDADAIREMLIKYCDFLPDNIYTLYDEKATHEAINELIHNTLPSIVKENDRLLIFFAGHAITRPQHGHNEKEGCIIPYDAKWSKKDLPKWNTLITFNDLVRETYSNVSARQTLFLLDCCFSGIAGKAGGFADKDSPAINMIRAAKEKTSLQILTASGRDELILDSGADPSHSLFTQAILDFMKNAKIVEYQEMFISATKMAIKVTNQVITDSLGQTRRQVPQFYRVQPPDELGEFVLRVFQESERKDGGEENIFEFSRMDHLIREADLLPVLNKQETIKSINRLIVEKYKDKVVSASEIYSIVYDYFKTDSFVSEQLKSIQIRLSISESEKEGIMNHLCLNMIILGMRERIFIPYVPEFERSIKRDKERAVKIKGDTDE